jgi:hypothetical protein
VYFFPALGSQGAQAVVFVFGIAVLACEAVPQEINIHSKILLDIL